MFSVVVTRTLNCSSVYTFQIIVRKFLESTMQVTVSCLGNLIIASGYLIFGWSIYLIIIHTSLLCALIDWQVESILFTAQLYLFIVEQTKTAQKTKYTSSETVCRSIFIHRSVQHMTPSVPDHNHTKLIILLIVNRVRLRYNLMLSCVKFKWNHIVILWSRHNILPDMSVVQIASLVFKNKQNELLSAVWCNAK